MKKIEEFDFVEIIVPTGKEFNEDRVGEVTRVDGCYIMVKRNISGVEIELYPHEIQLLEGEKAQMAWFQRNMWRGLAVPEDTDYNWLTAGYLREVDWEAAQEENVTTTYDLLKSIDDCEKTAKNISHMANAVLKTGKNIAPDNTEKMMTDTMKRAGESMGDIRELLEEIENDKASPEDVKKLARSTAKYLKDFENEVSYDDAMEIVKK